MLFLLVIPIVGIVTGLLVYTDTSNKETRIENSIMWGIVLSVLSSIVVVIVVGIVFLMSVGRVNSIETYAEANQGIYKYSVVTLREGIPLELNSSKLLDTANLKQIDSFADSVQNQRDTAVAFNNKIKRNRYWEDNIVFGLFVRDLDPSIQMVTEKDLSR